nr:DUF305 domain-containing protein [Microbacterium sp. CFH 90308]
MSLALVTAGAAVAIAIAAGTDAAGRAASEPTTPGGAESLGGATATARVTADDYCYVEAMIYYRVEETELAQSLLAKDGVAPEARAFAAETAERDAAELEHLREWYVSWADARPLEPPADGPCAGHGADHAQMPGMPSWSRQLALAEAVPPVAEREFIGILQAQTTGMVALVSLILDGDPHPDVRESAEGVLARASEDAEMLDELLVGLP